jgi:uncharacterized damage-inducible protein DinB
MRITLRSAVSCFALAAAFAALAAPAQAQSGAAGFRAAWLSDYQEVTGKITQLADAFPADKLAWRPAEGVRSAGEVIGHIAVANYFLPSFMGHAMPEGMTMESEKQADPAKLHQMLAESIVHLRKVFDETSDADLAKTAEFFGHQKSYQEMLLITLGHLHEHLGQLIAYARMNGIVPPWSAKAAAGGAQGG